MIPLHLGEKHKIPKVFETNQNNNMHKYDSYKARDYIKLCT